MRWRFRPSARAGSGPAGPSAPGGGDPPAVHRSPGLKLVLHELAALPRLAVLDLGPALPENIAFFSQRRGRLAIEDLARTLALGTGAGRRVPEGRLLSSPGDTRFDLVLAWDLLDYLPEPILGTLVSHLPEICLPGALLFALPSYRSEIPLRPLTFRIRDAESLEYADLGPPLMPGPRRNLRELEQLLVGFRLRSSFLLRNGRQEFIFACEG